MAIRYLTQLRKLQECTFIIEIDKHLVFHKENEKKNVVFIFQYEPMFLINAML